MLVPFLKDFTNLITKENNINVLILGSTGSIGTSTLDIIEANSEKFNVYALVAGKNILLLKQQILKFKPKFAACSIEKDAIELIEFIKENNLNTEIVFGEQSICILTQDVNVDLVVAAIVGVAGLLPVYSAIKAKKKIALANKESLVSAGQFIKEALFKGIDKNLDSNNLQENKSYIIPVDSEHSAIYQVLQAERKQDLKKIILTASGGPFRTRDKNTFSDILPMHALKHPNWTMGAKITIDSATLMNKGLEIIEAYWLYGEEIEKIEVLVHPQSIIHSLIELVDGTQLAQLSVPDMKGAIAYAMNYPNGRIKNVMPALSLDKIGELTFFKNDNEKFPSINLAFQSIKQAGVYSAVYNLANEVAVEAFLNSKISFDKIFSFVEQALSKNYRAVKSMEELIMFLGEERIKLKELIN